MSHTPRPSGDVPARRPSGDELRPEHVRALRLGHGANCSSVGSVVDTLFLGAAVGGAIFAAICAAMREEPMRVAGGSNTRRDDVRADDGERAPDEPGAPEPASEREEPSS